MSAQRMFAATAGGEAQLPECDLVMKGGITSGVVYPSAVQELAKAYRFRSIGGASAGAIAAVVTAACEYRRRCGHVDAFERLSAVTDEIVQPRFIERLFQPAPEAKPGFEVALAYVASQQRKLLRVLAVVWAALRRGLAFTALAALGIVTLAVFAAVTIRALAGGGISDWDVGAFILLGAGLAPAAITVVVLAAMAALARFGLALNTALKANGLGLCSGRTQPGYARPALTDWLHQTIQDCAGLPPEQPLTFAMLRWPPDGRPPDDPEAKPEVNLQLITTDLSYSRPVNLPLTAQPPAAGQTQYYFDETEMARLFPDAVVRAMTGEQPAVQLVRGSGRKLHPMPGEDLPVVVAARLSLSFPLLLSTVPLWSQHPKLPYLVQHCMSDGGISSNFPVHFFDALFPGRPTFGLDLQPYPDPRQDEALARSNEPYVVFGDEPRLPRFSSVDSVFTFFHQLLNAARNWRDSMQAELPGYRDRICEIRLTRREGGLNLNMTPEIVEALIDRGTEAGETIRGVDPESGRKNFDWNRHRWVRYLTMMEMLQASLRDAGPKFADFAAAVTAIPSDWPYRDTHEPPWWDDAHPLTTAFFSEITWGEDGVTDFATNAPVPQPALRIIPKV